MKSQLKQITVFLHHEKMKSIKSNKYKINVGLSGLSEGLTDEFKLAILNSFIW